MKAANLLQIRKASDDFHQLGFERTTRAPTPEFLHL